MDYMGLDLDEITALLARDDPTRADPPQMAMGSPPVATTPMAPVCGGMTADQMASRRLTRASHQLDGATTLTLPVGAQAAVQVGVQSADETDPNPEPRAPSPEP